MFKIKTQRWHDDYQAIQLYHESEKISISILPELGGMLNNYTVNGQNVIDGVTLDAKGIEQYLDAYPSAFLCPFPSRITNGKFQFNNKTHQLSCNDVVHHTALHGFIADKKFTIKKTEVGAKHVSIVLNYIYDGHLDGFPYPFEVDIEYILDISGQLTFYSKITNTGESNFPIGIGWHHYFTLGEPVDNLELNILSKHKIEFDEHLLPTGQIIDCKQVKGEISNKNYDTCFVLDGSIIKLKGKDVTLEIDVDYSTFPYLQIYTPDHRNSIAIEPMTCIPNAFNNKIGLKILEKGDVFEQVFNLQIKQIK